MRLCSVLIPDLVDGFGEDRPGVLVRVGVGVLFVEVEVPDVIPESVLFDPVNFAGEVRVTLGLIFPGIGALGFVVADVLLATIGAIVDDAEVTAVQDAGVLSVLDLDGQHTGGVLGIIVSGGGKQIPISENWSVPRVVRSIRVRDPVKSLAKDLPDLFGGVFFIRVVYLNVDVEIEACVGGGVPGDHIPLAAAHKAEPKGKVLPHFVLQFSDDLQKLLINGLPFFLWHILIMIHLRAAPLCNKSLEYSTKSVVVNMLVFLSDFISCGECFVRTGQSKAERKFQKWSNCTG